MQNGTTYVKLPVLCHHGAPDTFASEHWTACAYMLPSADWLHLLCSGHVGQCLHQDHRDQLCLVMLEEVESSGILIDMQ